MTLTISLPSQSEAALQRRAAASGEDIETYVAKLVQHFAEPPTPIEVLSGPIYQRFLDSGMTDDELGDHLEQARHEARKERRANSSR